MTDGLDDKLEKWDTLANQHDWSGLLIGNGFSQNIWQKFGYTSLFEEAASADPGSLTAADISLFEKLQTQNFEQVLSALSTAKSVASALGEDFTEIAAREHSIRAALIHAVHSVHIPWASLSEFILDKVCKELSNFASIYCTNYDLIPYWSIMRDQSAFRDYLWSNFFDIADTEIWGKKSKFHFLHGGLHLIKSPSGETSKRKAEVGKNLLDIFGETVGGETPLFVSEGSAEEKLASIRKSDYLTFVFSCLRQDAGPLVVFGHSLGETDRHIVDAIGAHADRPIAVSIRAEGNIRQKKAALVKALPNAELSFFDAATHPLGSADLRIEEAAK